MSSATAPATIKTDRSGAWAVALGAAVWGLFWIPLRYVDELGITGLWSIALITGTAFVPALLVTLWKVELREFLNPDCCLVGLALGLSMVLYFTGVLYSDVIRVIFLFYLLPLWTTLSARIIYGEPIRQAQLLVIAAALTGVWLLLGGGNSLPIPRNVGDWCGIAAGLCWGISLSLLRGRGQTPSLPTTAASLAVALVLSVVGAVTAHWFNTNQSINSWIPAQSLWLDALPLALLFGAIVLYPAMLGQIWGARRIPAPTAALLTMTEILVATTSAGWLIGTDLQSVSMLGGLIIIMAVGIDLAVQRRAD